MKSKIQFLSVALVMLMIALGFQAQAQTKKTEKVEFKVYGNCTQCKERIEMACDIKGVKHAEWNVETKALIVVYNPEKTDLDKIHAAIAASGHDTEKVKAPDSVYVKLPDCCLYREKPHTHTD